MPSLKIIEPDGNFIKKEQIMELKRSFSTYSQITDKKIYIIKNCEKMNKESANTMLKFIEEPTSDIIGFFITNSANNVIETIRSRCQLIEENFDISFEEMLGLSKDEFEELFDIAKKYIIEIDGKGKKLILSNLLLNDFEKDKIVKIFQIILEIYYKVLHNDENFISENSDISFMTNYKIKNILKKISLIIDLLKKTNYNVNVDLLLDDFALEMDGINNEVV